MKRTFVIGLCILLLGCGSGQKVVEEHIEGNDVPEQQETIDVETDTANETEELEIIAEENVEEKQEEQIQEEPQEDPTDEQVESVAEPSNENEGEINENGEVTEDIIPTEEPVVETQEEIEVETNDKVEENILDIQEQDEKEVVEIQEEEAEEISEQTKDTDLVQASAKKNGFIKENGNTYYYKDNKKVTGWQTISGKKYYFNRQGKMLTGLQEIGDDLYFFNNNGTLYTGLKQIIMKDGDGIVWDKETYYFDRDGKAVSGWQTVGKDKYYFTGHKAAATGCHYIEGNGKLYYFDGDGKMKTNFIYTGKDPRNPFNQKTYEIYFGSDGVGVIKGEVEVVPDACEVSIKPIKVKDVKSGKQKITYELFGAKGDGKTNDYEAIDQAHRCGEALGTTVYGTSNKTYYIKESNPITIKTNTNWNNAKFIIDDSVDRLYDPIFIITNEPSKESELSNIFGKLNINKNNKYIRKGANAGLGNDSLTELALYDNQTKKFIVQPQKNYMWEEYAKNRILFNKKQITIQNGYFTTINSKNRGDYRYGGGILIESTGNIKLNNIHHFIKDENEVSNYYGFIRINKSAYIEANNIKLTPHKYANNHGTYDLVINSSINVTFNDLGYACNVFKKDGSIDYNACYKKTMINPDVWGVMSMNNVKNVVFNNPKVNRIDAHRGVDNLVIRGGTIGDKGLTLIGTGRALIENVTFDRSNRILTLRDDYGSTWDGTIFFDNIKYIMEDGKSTGNLIYANNDGTWNFGYDCVFPNIYLRNLTIDSTRYKGKTINVLDIGDTKGNGKYKYKFRGNLNFVNIVANKNKNLNIINPKFTKNANNLKKSSYGSNGISIVYTQKSGHAMTNPLSKTKSDMFKVVLNNSAETNFNKQYQIHIDELNRMINNMKLNK